MEHTSPISRRFFTVFVLCLLGINLLVGGVTALRMLDLPPILMLIFNYLCRLLTLSVQFAGMGTVFYLLSREEILRAFYALCFTACGILLALLTAGIAESFNYLDYGYVSALLSQIGSALLNTLIYFLLYGALMVLAYILFMRKKSGKPYTIRLFARTPVNASALLTAVVLFAIELPGQIIETVDFVNTYWPNIYKNEIVSIVIDFNFLWISALVGYLVAVLAAMLFAAEAEENS